jgi:hypothetical protein
VCPWNEIPAILAYPSGFFNEGMIPPLAINITGTADIFEGN